jgi:hypothetical protein
MSKIRVQVHARELLFLGWIGITLCLIGGYLLSGQGLVEQPGSAWRRIDLKALQQRIEGGDLRDREAAWYRPVEHIGGGHSP